MKFFQFALALALIVSAFTGFGINQASAQTPAPAEAQKAKLELKTVAPDTNAGEESHIQQWLGGKLIQDTISYKNGNITVREYRPADGTLSGMVEYTAAKKITITKYRADGVAKESTLETQPKGDTIETTYHKDGKTPYSVTNAHDRGDTDDEIWFYNKDGKLALYRQNVGWPVKDTVYNDKGEVVYKQVWVNGAVGPVVLEVEETTASGVHRRIHLRGGTKKVEYLKEDGSVEKTESVEKGSLNLAEPIAPERLKVTAPPAK